MDYTGIVTSVMEPPTGKYPWKAIGILIWRACAVEVIY